MIRRPTAWRAFLIGPAAAGLTALAASPAAAHGAPVDPVSRVAACSSLSGMYASTAACRAAIAQHGGQPFDDWDNLRVAGVAGRDRQVIPDGKLCSGGLDEYRGLDVARADWPATRFTAGARFTLTYRTTIPHSGSFELYLTKAGYDPSKPLTWSEISAKPFLTVTDPPVTNGAYHLSGRLPAAAPTGRQMLYTVWRNTSTSDTYYSCSDVVLSRAAAPTPTHTPTTAPASEPAAKPASATPAARSSAPATPAPTPTAAPASSAPATPAPQVEPVSASGTDDHARLLAAATGAAVLAAGAVAALTLRRRRRP